MEQNFTLNQCIRLLYGELTQDEGIMLKSLIRTIPKLKEKYQEMVRAKGLLNEYTERPSDQSVNTILRYSKKNSLLVSL